MMVKRVHEVWMRGNITSAILMDVKGAFPSIVKGNLIQIMEDMGCEADLYY
jgi:hypothetical protein